MCKGQRNETNRFQTEKWGTIMTDQGSGSAWNELIAECDSSADEKHDFSHSSSHVFIGIQNSKLLIIGKTKKNW